jgi:opacity protein-like surface antigen
MKKFLIGAFIFVASVKTINAQQKIGEGLLQYNAGVGASNRGVPIYVGADYGVYENVTVGGEFSMRSYQSRYYEYIYRNRLFGFAANGNYHFNEIANLPVEFDFYAGLMIGLFIWDGSPEYANNTLLSAGGQVGARYKVQKNLHVNAELQAGGAFSGLKVGVTYRP